MTALVPTIVNAFSVDVEDYFHVLAFEPQISRQTWAERELRVHRGVDQLLQLMSDAGISGTFFTLGWVAERAPDLVKRIAAAGHEVACHGYWHERVTELTPERFRSDVLASKTLLEDLTSQPVIGYRAPSYSINESNLWAFSVLEDLDFKYSSSVYPGNHDIYGMPTAPRFRFRPEGRTLSELPVTTVEFGGRRLPCSGGGFFRLLPYAAFRAAVRRVNVTDRQSAIFYIHPWELDQAQPRIAGASARSRFRHYLNLSRVVPRLERLLGDFKWDRMDRVFGFQAS
jgi:polysaccharide deacetylase family protein (PEP-CTERM system associated)